MEKSNLSEMYSVVSYTGDGTLKEFSVPFPYLYREDVHAYFINYDEDGNEVRQELKVYPLIQTSLPPATFDVYWLSDSILKFVNAPASGQAIEVRRITNRFEPEVVFNNSAILSEEDLNLISTQLLYVVQEAYDNQSLIQIELEKFTLEKLNITVNAAAEAKADAEATEADRVEVSQLAAQVAAHKASVDISKQSIDFSEAAVNRMTAQVMDYADELTLFSENLYNVQTIGNNASAIQAIAADLQGYPIVEFDGGFIGDPHQSMNGVGGVLKMCADNIEAIRKVAESLENASAITTLAEDVTELTQTDYPTIANTGETGEASGEV
jgi:hypothetical protein